MAVLERLEWKALVSGAELTIRVSTADGDFERVDQATGSLRDELLDAEAGSIALGNGASIPPGARSGAYYVVGEILVSALSSTAALVTTVDIVLQWIKRNSRYCVRMSLHGNELEITNATQGTARELASMWLGKALKSKE